MQDKVLNTNPNPKPYKPRTSMREGVGPRDAGKMAPSLVLLISNVPAPCHSAQPLLVREREERARARVSERERARERAKQTDRERTIEKARELKSARASGQATTTSSSSFFSMNPNDCFLEFASEKNMRLDVHRVRGTIFFSVWFRTKPDS